MCGITGYIGSEEAAPILIRGLARLEYRGYDSAGIAVLDGGRLLACGTHEELLERSSIYREICASQFRAGASGKEKANG